MYYNPNRYSEALDPIFALYYYYYYFKDSSS